MGSWELDLGSGETLWSEGMYRILGLPPVRSGAPRRRFSSTYIPMTVSGCGGCWPT